MAIPQQKYFQEKDFENTEYVATLNNSTTQTSLPKEVAVPIVEIESRSIALLVPSGICTTGHSLVLEIFRKNDFNEVKTKDGVLRDQKKILSLTAKVIQKESNEAGKFYVSLEIKQVVEKEWKALFEEIQEMKTSRAHTFRIVKGGG